MLSFCEAPRPEGDGIPFVRRVGPGDALKLAIAAKAPIWVVVHWRGQVLKTRVCRAKRDKSAKLIDAQGCDGCKGENPERIQGYLWVFNYGNHKHEWLEITAFCWDCITTQGGRDSELLGCELTITRGKGPKTRFFVSVSEPRASWLNQPKMAVPSPEPALLKIMG